MLLWTLVCGVLATLFILSVLLVVCDVKMIGSRLEGPLFYWLFRLSVVVVNFDFGVLGALVSDAAFGGVLCWSAI